MMAKSSFRGRAALTALALIAGLSPVLAQTADDAKFDAAIRKFIKENPEVLLDSINTYIAKQQEQQKVDADKQILAVENELVGDASTPSIGNPKGKVTLVYVLDAACGYCRRMTNALTTIAAADPDVRIVQRWVPFLSTASEYAGRVAHLIYKRHQHRYADWYKTLMSQTGPLTNEMVDKVTAVVLGAEAVDVIRSDTTSINSAEAAGLAATMKGNLDLAQRAGIKGTPFILVVGAEADGMFRGATTSDVIEAVITRSKAKSKSAGQ